LINLCVILFDESERRFCVPAPLNSFLSLFILRM
jgi:hypothetical protein